MNDPLLKNMWKMASFRTFFQKCQCWVSKSVSGNKKIIYAKRVCLNVESCFWFFITIMYVCYAIFVSMWYIFVLSISKALNCRSQTLNMKSLVALWAKSVMTKIAVTIRRYSEKIATMRNFGTIQENVCLGAHTKQECSRKRKILFK